MLLISWVHSWIQFTVTWFTNLLVNRESKKAKYGRFWAIFGLFWANRDIATWLTNLLTPLIVPKMRQFPQRDWNCLFPVSVTFYSLLVLQVKSSLKCDSALKTENSSAFEQILFRSNLEKEFLTHVRQITYGFLKFSDNWKLDELQREHLQYDLQIWLIRCYRLDSFAALIVGHGC